MKKALKISVVTIGFLLLIIFALPFVFKGKIQTGIQKEINKNLNAVVKFDGVGVSLFRHFPDLTVKIKNLEVKGTGDFEKDTLASIPALSLTLDLVSVLKGNAYKVKQINLSSPRLLFKVLASGKTNWDIMKESATADSADETSAFIVYLENVRLTDSHIIYDDEEIPTKLVFDGLSGNLSGDMTVDHTALQINATCENITADYDGIRYLSKSNAKVTTIMDADFSTWTFTFKDGKLRLNDLNITADGYFAMPDEGYKMDIRFAAKENTFKAFLSLIPAIYSKDFEKIKSSGTLVLDGFVKGLYNDISMPAFGVNMKVVNGQFSYPGLPGNVSDVNLEAVISNQDGIMDHTIIDVPRMHLSMMQNPLDITLSMLTPVSDPDIKATVNGHLDLSMVPKFYPLDEKIKLSGNLSADMAFSGKVSAIEKGAYDQFKASGFAAVDKLLYEGEEIPLLLNISKARLDFNPAYAQLSDMVMTIGKNDLTANGKVENYIPYLLKKNAVLKGVITTNSSYMDINSLITGSVLTETGADTSLTVLQIPGDLDISLNTTFSRLLYNNFDMHNVSGSVKVKDHTLIIDGIQVQMLGGSLALKGSYSTYDPAKPLVDMDLQIKTIDVKRSFEAFTSIQKFAPIAEKLKGTISTNLKFKGALKQDMIPELSSVSAYGLVLSDILSINGVNTFEKIADVLKIEKLRNPSLEKINLSFDVVDGKATVKPMDFKLGSFKSTFSGTTSLDQVLNFILTIEIPRAEFGSKANNVLDGLVKDASQKGVNVTLSDIVPVTILIGGTATDPKITAGIKSAMAGLAEEMKQQATAEVEKKKEEIISKAKEEASALIIKADAEAAKIIADAEKQSQKLIAEANKTADQVRFAADSSANRVIAEGKKNGYIAEIAAKKAAEKIRKEGDVQANKLISEAQKQSDAIISRAQSEAEKIKQDALNRVK